MTIHANHSFLFKVNSYFSKSVLSNFITILPYLYGEKCSHMYNLYLPPLSLSICVFVIETLLCICTHIHTSICKYFINIYLILVILLDERENS